MTYRQLPKSLVYRLMGLADGVESKRNIELKATIRRRGRSHGTQRTLTPEQEKRIQKAIVDKEPDQLKLSFALWTRIAVQQLIRELLSIDMLIRTVGEYLCRWGFIPQKPLRRAYEQNPKMVMKWLDEQYPAIAAKAKKERAEIHWGG